MATRNSLLSLLLLALVITCAFSARILEDDSVDDPAPTITPAGAAVGGTGATVGGSGAAVGGSGAAVGGSGAAVGSSGAAVGGTGVAVGVAGAAVGGAPVGGTGGAVGGVGPDNTISFFMHDILGGSNPSARAVTGVVTNPAVNGQVPFAKPNGAVLPGNNGNSGIINNNNLPFLTGLGGNTNNVIQNNGNNNFNNGGSGFNFNGGQLPQGAALQKLMFGTLTVIDDELTEGHELGSGLIGKAQGLYVSSAVDGSSQTMAFTVMLENGSYADSISLFGVHRTAVSESHLAVMGGTGKYVNAKGHAIVKTIPGGNQHVTDGLETLLQITIYLAY